MPTVTAPSRFAGLSLYAVLGVDVGASADVIKRGYRRAALKYHPDHNRSPDANDEFTYLAHAHDILSNQHSRTLYDDTGAHDSSSHHSSDTDPSVSSADYWRSVFPAVSAADIEAFRVKYVGSDEEVADIQAVYQRYEGNIQHVLDSVPFAEADSIPRLCQLLNTHCQARITPAKQRRLQKRAEEWQREEAAEFEQLAVTGSAEEKEAAQAAGDMTQLVALLARRKEEAQHKQEQWLQYMGDKYGAATKHTRPRKGKKQIEDDETKEVDGAGDRMADEPSEEEFQRIQAEMLKRREASKANGLTSSASGKKVSNATQSDVKRRKTKK